MGEKVGQEDKGVEEKPSGIYDLMCSFFRICLPMLLVGRNTVLLFEGKNCRTRFLKKYIKSPSGCLNSTVFHNNLLGRKLNLIDTYIQH